MDRNDQQAIQSLFGKLADVERQAAPRDGEAEAFIRDQIARQPGAPYYMAQTIVVQEQALNAAQARIEELEQAVSRPAGGLFSSLFGGGRQPPRRVPQRQYAPPQQPAGGGFLAGAAQTAMGVAGGVLLGNAIMGLLGGDEAQAADEAPPEDEGYDETAFDDGGGFGDEFRSTIGPTCATGPGKDGPVCLSRAARRAFRPPHSRFSLTLRLPHGSNSAGAMRGRQPPAKAEKR